MNTNLKLATQILSHGAQNGKNVVCSPALLEVVLCMVASGAKGKTLELLLDFIGVDSFEDINLKSASLKVISLVSKNSSNVVDDKPRGVKLYLASGVWVDEDFPVTPSYKEILNHIYNVEPKAVDFIHQADQIVEEVNAWVSKSTKGLVNSILSKENLVEGTTRMLLANALYFKGAWAKAFIFDHSYTAAGTFHLICGKRISVPLMNKGWVDCTYDSQMGFKALKIPYENSVESLRFAMYFFLPDKKDGLNALIEKLKDDFESFTKIFLKVRRTEMFEVVIPKFKVEYEFKASTSMKELGLSRLFEPVKELTGIVASPQGDELFVEDVFQKAIVKIDEKGTEATAVITRLKGGGGGQPPNPSFIADHPFMFMIREDTSGAILFTGAVLDPRE